MKNINKYLIALLFVSVLVYSSCSKEEDLIPSNGEYGYEMPQGNSDYDDRIMQYYKDLDGVCFLYNYVDNDSYLTTRYYFKAVWSSVAKSWNGIEIKPNRYYIYEHADKNYIIKLLDLLDEIWFNFYEKDKLKEYMPLKILLASTLSTPTVTTSQVLADVKCLSILDKVYRQLSIGWCDSRLDNITPAEKRAFMIDVNTLYLRTYMNTLGYIEMPFDFTSVSPYSASGSKESKTFFPQGFINKFNSNMNNPLGDWWDFFTAIITTPLAELETYASRETDTTYKGILCKDTKGADGKSQLPKDPYGNTRKKYNAIVAYYKSTFGVDLVKLSAAIHSIK